MAVHSLEPDRYTLHGHFSRDLLPALVIDPGDTVRLRTLDASWYCFDNSDPFHLPARFLQRDPEKDSGHALCGPIAIRGSHPGMTLEVRLKRIRPGGWGWCCSLASGGEYEKLGFDHPDRFNLGWQIDAAVGIAKNQFGQQIQIRPFMGVLGMPPDSPGMHSTVPPRFCGGNLDCKELVEGSRLFLPIAVDQALFSVGDGHAVQGDGEVAGPGLECPMSCVELEFLLHRELGQAMPWAETPVGWITFGLHEDLNEAWTIAMHGMLDLMQRIHKLTRAHALALASLVVDLHVTQVVNGVKGVHAVLPRQAWTEEATGRGPVL